MERAFREILTVNASPIDWKEYVSGAMAEGRFDELVVQRLVGESRKWEPEELVDTPLGDPSAPVVTPQYLAFQRLADLARLFPSETFASPGWKQLIADVIQSTSSRVPHTQLWGFRMAHALSVRSPERSAKFTEAGVFMKAMSVIMYGDDQDVAIWARAFIDDATRNMPVVAQRMASEDFIRSVVTRTLVQPAARDTAATTYVATWRAEMGLSLLSGVASQSAEFANMLLRALNGRVDTLVQFCPRDACAIRLVEVLCSHSPDAFQSLLVRPDLVDTLVSVLDSTVPMLSSRVGRTLSMLTAYGNPEVLPRLFSVATVNKIMLELLNCANTYTVYDDTNHQHCFVRALHCLLSRGPKECEDAFCTGRSGFTIVVEMLYNSTNVKHTSEILAVIARLCVSNPRVGHYLNDAKLRDTIRLIVREQTSRQPFLLKDKYYIQCVREALLALEHVTT